jgi:hypothetical protein
MVFKTKKKLTSSAWGGLKDGTPTLVCRHDDRLRCERYGAQTGGRKRDYLKRGPTRAKVTRDNEGVSVRADISRECYETTGRRTIPFRP